MTAATAMRRFVLAAVPVALVLAGCGSDAPPPLCPPVGTPAPLDTFTQFEPGSGRDLTQVRFSGRLAAINSACEYDTDGVDVELAIQMVVERGPADRDRNAELQYFVAVENGPGNITAKQVFDVAIPFEGNSRRLARLEEISLQIPPAGEQGFSRTRILVGFQLSAEQLEHNRRRAP